MLTPENHNSRFNDSRFSELVQILHRIVDLLGLHLQQTSGIVKSTDAQVPYGCEGLNEERKRLAGAIHLMSCAYRGIKTEDMARHANAPPSLLWGVGEDPPPREFEDAALQSAAEHEAESNNQARRAAALAAALVAAEYDEEQHRRSNQARPVPRGRKQEARGARRGGDCHDDSREQGSCRRDSNPHRPGDQGSSD